MWGMLLNLAPRWLSESVPVECLFHDAGKPRSPPIHQRVLGASRLGALGAPTVD